MKQSIDKHNIQINQQDVIGIGEEGKLNVKQKNGIAKKAATNKDKIGKINTFAPSSIRCPGRTAGQRIRHWDECPDSFAPPESPPGQSSFAKS